MLNTHGHTASKFQIEPSAQACLTSTLMLCTWLSVKMFLHFSLRGNPFSQWCTFNWLHSASWENQAPPHLRPTNWLDRGCLANMFVVIKSLMGAGPLLRRNSREDSLFHHPYTFHLGTKQAFTVGLFLSLFSWGPTLKVPNMPTFQSEVFTISAELTKELLRFQFCKPSFTTYLQDIQEVEDSWMFDSPLRH